MYYQIKETLIESTKEKCLDRSIPYVALVTKEEFENTTDLFDMGIELDLVYDDSATTKVEVNYDSLTGHFSIPAREDEMETSHDFAFVMDDHGVVFINDDGTARKIIDRIRLTKKWKLPSLERFFYDFLEGIVAGDIPMLEKYDCELDAMEDRILDGNIEGIMTRMVDIRSILLQLRPHYEQLIDLAQELEENENDFFAEENLRYFHLFKERASRLQDVLSALREHTMQVRDLHQAQIDVRQNRNMTVLTIIAAIFTPLTLITGWFGMNFKYMPELDQPWAYPLVAVVCLIIVISAVIFFKKKKML